MPIISIIAAITKDRGLGKDNQLLVHLSPDLKHFKAITTGHPVIMGQNTWASLGRPLLNRTNIVLTRDSNFSAAGCVVLHSISEALAYSQTLETDEVFVIGGASIYSQMLPYADKLYLTLIEAIYPADTFFPDYSQFNKIESESDTMEHEGIKFKYLVLTK